MKPIMGYSQEMETCEGGGEVVTVKGGGQQGLGGLEFLYGPT